MSRYPKQLNIVSEVTLVAFACCDCGLVHKMGFTVDDDGAVALAFERQNRRTAQLRRGKFPYLKNPLKDDKWKMVRIK